MNEGYELLVTAGVSPEKMEECMEWAFGQGWEFAPTLEHLRLLWNDKHDDIFYVGEGDSYRMFIMGVGKAFMEVNYHDTVRSEAKRRLA